MWWWKKVRLANIPADVREAFEQTGKFGVGAELAADFPPARALLRDKNYVDGHIKQYGRDWMREQMEREERREDRLETVEWAILIAVIVGVAADFAIVAHEIGWLHPN